MNDDGKVVLQGGEAPLAHHLSKAWKWKLERDHHHCSDAVSCCIALLCHISHGQCSLMAAFFQANESNPFAFFSERGLARRHVQGEGEHLGATEPSLSHVIDDRKEGPQK
jgi:hypothetical protein